MSVHVTHFHFPSNNKTMQTTKGIQNFENSKARRKKVDYTEDIEYYTNINYIKFQLLLNHIKFQFNILLLMHREKI